ncbi:G-protein-signaling modulator 1 [Embiotoca jacksoni]|uniref:G-protein-signaling modulator 1 n=1 Tax=Embiotoca jacksoni TaxID=100190 RepID=UPI003703A0EB
MAEPEASDLPGEMGGGTGPKSSPTPHQNGRVDSIPEHRVVSVPGHRVDSLEEPEALLDLVLEVQCQRLEEQRASLSLLPDPGPAALCGTCSPDQNPFPGLDFYYMLIHYQSDRMEDQRCPLPDLDDVAPEGQEDFLHLVQRVQSRRMDEQRASLLLRHLEDEHAAGSSPHHYHHH